MDHLLFVDVCLFVSLSFSNESDVCYCYCLLNCPIKFCNSYYPFYVLITKCDLFFISLATLSRLSSDRIACDHENCLSTEEIKFLQTDDRTIDLISQTDQHDTPVPEHDDTDSDNQSYELAYESMTGINQIEDNKSVTYNSTGTSTKYEISKPVFQNGDKEVSRSKNFFFWMFTFNLLLS